MNGNVSELLRRPPVTCGRHDSVAVVAALMQRGAVIVLADDGAPLGIVTDRDIRVKLVAAQRDAAATRAADLMSTPLVTVAPETAALEALLEMTRRDIHHLVVTREGRMLGVLSSDDLIAVQAAHPVTLVREIARASSTDALARLAADTTTLVQHLLDDGGRAGEIARVVAEINDRLVVRVLEQAEAALAQAGEKPPVPYCWMVFGSEGRREQTLRTDQDNGLVYAEPEADRADAAARFFARLAGEAIASLVAVGFPPCPGGAMASNARWCQPLSVWQDYFRDWIARGNVLAASMYFDLRPAHGEPALAETLGGAARNDAKSNRRFLATMARDVVDRVLPLGWFGGVKAARSGPHRGCVDIKGAGGLQIVGAARVYALELGFADSNTEARIRAAAWHGLYSEAMAREIGDAYEDLLRLRLEHQLACLREGRPPDNYVDPWRLSHRDGVLLADALRAAASMQHALRERFATDFLS